MSVAPQAAECVEEAGLLSGDFHGADMELQPLKGRGVVEGTGAQKGQRTLLAVLIGLQHLASFAPHCPVQRGRTPTL